MGPPCAPPPRGQSPGEPHLGGCHQLGCAGRDLVRADDELLVLARVQHHFVRRLPGGQRPGGGVWPGSPTPWTARHPHAPSPNPEHPHLAPSTPPPDLGQHTPVGWLPSPQPWRQRSGLPSTLNSWHKIPAAWLPPSGDRRTGRTSQGCHQGDTRSPGVSPSPVTQPQGRTPGLWFLGTLQALGEDQLPPLCTLQGSHAQKEPWGES